MRIETRVEPCGTIVYSALVVPHDWSPKPLNHSEVVRFVKKIWDNQKFWGHGFADGSRCNGKCAE